MSSEGEEFFDCHDGETTDDELCEIIFTKRGGGKLSHKGYMYYKDKQVMNCSVIFFTFG